MTSLSCRGCGALGLESVLSLGEQPPSNALLTTETLSEPEPRYPLDLAFCPACALAQITVSVDPTVLFAEYAYFSSYSDTMLTHAEDIAARMVQERHLGADDLAVEVASNDGYLLQYYLRAGVPVLGIDPAANVAEAARERGVETVVDFFGTGLARRLREEGRSASVLHANNVLAHVPDINGVVEGMATLLTDDGAVVTESPYVRDLVEKLEFDTIYHEHLFYYSLTATHALFARNGLEVVDVERIPIHGGSLRVFAARSGTPSTAVRDLLGEERGLGMTDASYFQGFAERVTRLGEKLRGTLSELKAQGKSVAAYGAAAKGAVLLNSFGIGAETIDFVADRSPHKQGRFMPGVQIPIVGPEALVERMPDAVLLLTWNFADEILDQQAEYRQRGGRFIIPVPEPVVV